MLNTQVLVVALMVWSAVGLQAETVAERLGYPADARLLIIHGDDIGMCHSANTAAFEAFEHGMVTCGSVMVPCPWFLETAAYAKAHPEADLGIHLTLTSEWKTYRWTPLAPISLVKGLFDAEGYMHHGVRQVYQHATATEVETELRAQINFALQHGLNPTHLDSHMGTLYYNPEYLQVALRLAEEYDIPFMFFRPSLELLEEIGEEGREAFVQLSSEMEKRNIPLLDALPSIPDTPVEDYEAAYKKLIADLKPGVSLVIVHLADESKEYQAITGSYPKRLAEFNVFTKPEMKTFIEEQNIHLIGWKDLLPLWKARQR
ncbi:MAG: polysaccharide deacetylase family protein [bacterium]|jgi:predicted glycoside hydrolase/deacetylase ChbG (UPF0249 family)|nr:polysaccharide deacetylase family protein [bacterium]